MDDYLSKPFKQMELAAQLTRWLPAASRDRSSGESMDGRTKFGAVGAEILDHQALDMIRELQDESAPDLLQQVIRVYLETAPQLLAQISDAFTRGDLAALRVAAHTLKSSSANLGASKLAELCRQIENAGRAGAIGPVVPRSAEVEHQYAAVCAALESELDGKQHEPPCMAPRPNRSL